MKAIFLAVIAAILAGCSTTGAQYYQSVADANARLIAIEQARANADAERYRALAEIAKTGDSAAKAVAAMAIAMGGQRGDARLIAPQPIQSEALQWATVLANPLTMGISGYFGMQTQMNASDNARMVSVSANQAFATMGATIGTAAVAGYPHIQAPVVAPSVVPQANVTTTTTNTTTTTSTDNSSHSASTVGDYSGQSSGNSGRIAGRDISDSTHEPTVVLQPGATVVTPADFVVTMP